MKRFGGYRDLLAAPAELVQYILLLMKAEGTHQKAEAWKAEIDRRWKEEGYR